MADAISSDSFTQLADGVPNYAIYSLDPDGRILTWNKGAEKIKGWKKAEVIGKYFDFLYLPADRKRRQPAKNLTHARERGLYQTEAKRVRKNGEEFLADITIVPVYDKDNKKPRGYLKVVADVTKRKQSEKDQVDANTLLRQEIERRKKIEKALKISNSELNAFATAAGHDLQEPLRMVTSYLQLIERRYKNLFDQDGREFLFFAIDGATRMKALISDLVEYSRIDTLAKPLKPTDVGNVVEKVIKSLKIAVEESRASITKDDLPVIISDDVQLSELFQNLISNAIKFRSEKPLRIHIGYQKKNGEHLFSVKDNGKGIDKKDLESIFLIFKQLGNRAERSGSGIGLSIARKIVNRHNGRIWVESEPGKGSTFHFSIPVSENKDKSKE